MTIALKRKIRSIPTRISQLAKKLNNFPFLVFSVILIAGVVYFFSFLFPFTNNAFVVANIMPVAADVSGFITAIYVENGQTVKKEQPLFQVYQEPYRLAYEQAKADYREAQARVEVIRQETRKNEALLAAAREDYNKANYEFDLKNTQQVTQAVSKLEIKKFDYQRKSLANTVKALEAQLRVDEEQIKQQQQKVLALEAAMNNAKINLDLTIVRAYADGMVDNLYLTNGTPIVRHQPLFSFIDTTHIYVQANFNEIDLRHVRTGDRVLIFPRMYLCSKVYHGIVAGSTWGANRQITESRSQLQTVTQNENNWVMLPQRLPVQIRITDYDPANFPLSIGSSAYVYIQTRRR